ncbi:helix-turn-helix domain-containing protein [Niabella hibiscisoli]|uniref:helix-turn-helix domain-containing protein n=1 Tax=Niabella hibiscisoli TaxID=1825928 RepID=UPI001F0F9DA2|nr:helix-turn-helix domain-containing protein [Niabella hibiscisoli]MCH5718761.1 hypothetical protein [Niabella hibiscisoli]
MSARGTTTELTIGGDAEIPADLNLKDATQKAEYRKIMEVLKRVQYNKTKAAALLNIDRKTLYNKLNLEKSRDKDN